MHTGTIKSFDIKLGFGFVTEDTSGEDIFIYITGFDRNKIRNLHPGQKISFDLCNDKGKKTACNIKMLSKF